MHKSGLSWNRSLRVTTRTWVAAGTAPGERVWSLRSVSGRAGDNHTARLRWIACLPFTFAGAVNPVAFPTDSVCTRRKAPRLASDKGGGEITWGNRRWVMGYLHEVHSWLRKSVILFLYSFVRETPFGLRGCLFFFVSPVFVADNCRVSSPRKVSATRGSLLHSCRCLEQQGAEEGASTLETDNHKVSNSCGLAVSSLHAKIHCLYHVNSMGYIIVLFAKLFHIRNQHQL